LISAGGFVIPFSNRREWAVVCIVSMTQLRCASIDIGSPAEVETATPRRGACINQWWPRLGHHGLLHELPPGFTDKKPILEITYFLCVAWEDADVKY
jgi:hypothetical protein